MINGLPQVGFDFDEPLYPWNELAHVASLKAGLCPPGTSRPPSWVPFEVYGCSAEEWYAVIDNEILNGDMYLQPIDPKIVDGIKRMYTRGYGVHIVTARGNFGPLGETIKKITLSSVIKAGLPHDTVTFTKDKVEAALSLHIDYMVDDHPKYHDPLVEAGVNSFLLDAPYNQDHPEKFWPEGRRVHDVFEYMRLIMDKHLRPADLTPAQRAHLRSPSNA